MFSGIFDMGSPVLALLAGSAIFAFGVHTMWEQRALLLSRHDASLTTARPACVHRFPVIGKDAIFVETDCTADPVPPEAAAAKKPDQVRRGERVEVAFKDASGIARTASIFMTAREVRAARDRGLVIVYRPGHREPVVRAPSLSGQLISLLVIPAAGLFLMGNFFSARQRRSAGDRPDGREG